MNTDPLRTMRDEMALPKTWQVIIDGQKSADLFFVANKESITGYSMTCGVVPVPTLSWEDSRTEPGQAHYVFTLCREPVYCYEVEP